MTNTIQEQHLHRIVVTSREQATVEGVIKTVDYLEDGPIGSARAKRKTLFDRLFK